MAPADLQDAAAESCGARNAVRAAAPHLHSPSRRLVLTYPGRWNFFTFAATAAGCAFVILTLGSGSGASLRPTLRMKLKSSPACCALPWQPMQPPMLYVAYEEPFDAFRKNVFRNC